MIRVTRINEAELVINADLIEFVEAIPDTMITLTTGKKIMVKESPDELIRRVAEFRRLSGIRHQLGRAVCSATRMSTRRSHGSAPPPARRPGRLPRRMCASRPR